jgi:multimeric flavodoxin WrbA
MAIVSVIYHSLRDHTTRQADAIVRGVSAVEGVETHLIRLSHEQLDTGGRWDDPAALRTLNASDGIVFGSVTLFGTVSAVFKTFLESTFGVWY